MTILFHEGNLLLAANSPSFYVPEDEKNLTFINEVSFQDNRALELCSGSPLPKGAVSIGLRESAEVLSEEDYRLAGKGAELLHWSRTQRYCSRCGAIMKQSSDISRRCPECGWEVFPFTSPCVIVRITHGDKIFLARNRRFKRPMFGLVAGFVETGETLEECVKREVMEETSMEVKDIRYHSSQPWPFPSQLMIGFTAEYAGGKINFADGELVEGGFFSRDNLPMLPSPPSIARRLIMEWIENKD